MVRLQLARPLSGVQFLPRAMNPPVTTPLPPLTTLTQSGLFATSTAIAQAAPSESASQGHESLLNQNTLPHTVCPGNGLDAASAGVIASLILSGAIGLLIWASRHFLAVFELIDYIQHAAHICRSPAPLSTNLWSARVVCSARVGVAIYFIFTYPQWLIGCDPNHWGLASSPS